MAEGSLISNEAVSGTGGKIATGIFYKLNCSHSSRFLDGMGANSEYVETHDSEDEPGSQKWVFTSSGALKPSHSSRYLDRMGSDSKYVEKHPLNPSKQRWVLSEFDKGFRIKA
jgi:hypothetical protein